MKIAYFDCFSGISGDMTLGALVDAGVPPEILTTGLATLKLDAEFNLHFEKAVKHGITGTRAIVDVHPAHAAHADAPHTHDHSHGHHHHHEHGPSRHLSDIFKLLDDSDLDSEVRDTVKRVFDRLAEAEAKVHNTTKANVHLHEVSGIDSIVDIGRVGYRFSTSGSRCSLRITALSRQRFRPMCTRSHACPRSRHDGTLTGCTDTANRHSQGISHADWRSPHYDTIARIRRHAADAAGSRRIRCWHPGP